MGSRGVRADASFILLPAYRSDRFHCGSHLPLRRSAVQRRTRWLDLLAEGDSLSQDFIDYLKETGRHADELMTKDVISATEETSLSELAELMVDRKIKRIPILHDGHLVGIVSRADIVKALANNPDAES